jgi:hypothetical protein
MVEANDSVTSEDGALKATLTAFDPRRGEGRVKIEELKAERGRFYVTVTYGEAGQTRIDYKTYDLCRPRPRGVQTAPSRGGSPGWLNY